jgi:hypothetical protein
LRTEREKDEGRKRAEVCKDNNQRGRRSEIRKRKRNERNCTRIERRIELKKGEKKEEKRKTRTIEKKERKE